jgi:hypothetical protein
MKPADAIPPADQPKHKPSEVIEEARKRYRTAWEYDKANVERFREAMRFVALEQWDANLKQWREAKKRPCLVMDRLGTHINQAVNDIRQSKPAIKVSPARGGATVDVAEVFNGVVRNIEYLSSAPQIYVHSAFSQIAGGQGAWRVLTRYVDDDTFDQEIYLQLIEDPTTVLLEPNHDPVQMNYQWGFVVSTMPKEQFKVEYPDANPADWVGVIDSEGWWNETEVRVAEYYRIVRTPTKIHMLDDGTVVDEDRLKRLMAQAQAQAPVGSMMPAPVPQVIKSRDATKDEVQWFKLGGNDVLESRIVPCKWIPLIKVVGNRVLVDNKPVITGLTHRAMDPQRMYNYQTSVVVEILSLQKTAPWVGAAGQFENFESEWDNANTNNPARLEYNPVEINGILVPPPKREMAPQVPTGNVQAMQLAAEDLQWVTGQHASNFGAKSNETSGRAILARQQEGDTATYHYLDNLSNGILHTGRIIVDMMPRLLDTKRIVRIIGEDGEADMIQHDPKQQQPMQKVETIEGAVKRIYNLTLGKYDVTVSVGPSYGTKRMEAVEAMTQLLQGNPELWQVIGDIYIGNQDWPGAQEMSKRLRKMVPPNLQDEEGEDPEAKMQQQIAQMQEALTAADQMMQQRDAALQQADQMIQQMQEQLATLKEQALKSATDIEARNRAAEVAAQAEVQVAEINGEVEALKSMQASMQTDVDTLRRLVEQAAQMAASAAEKDEEGAEGAERGEETEPNPAALQAEAMITQMAELLGRIAESQAALQQAAAEMLNRPRSIAIQRDPAGNIIGARTE